MTIDFTLSEVRALANVTELHLHDDDPALSTALLKLLRVQAQIKQAAIRQRGITAKGVT